MNLSLILSIALGVGLGIVLGWFLLVHSPRLLQGVWVTVRSGGGSLRAWMYGACGVVLGFGGAVLTQNIGLARVSLDGLLIACATLACLGWLGGAVHHHRLEHEHRKYHGPREP